MICLFALALCGLMAGGPGVAEAARFGAYKLPLDGVIVDMRAMDLDGDDRAEVVALMEPTAEKRADGAVAWLALLRGPSQTTARTWFDPAAEVRIPLDGELARVGAIAIGRFGPGGERRIRLFGPTGIRELGANGKMLPAEARLAVPTLLGRTPTRQAVFWSGVADLDGDGLDECWFPEGEGNGTYRVLGGKAAQDTRLDLSAGNNARTTAEHLLVRIAYLPTLTPADLDGDGKRELVALQGTMLNRWAFPASQAGTDALQAASGGVELPFLAVDPDLPENELRTPRLQLADADGDGTTDLLVTLVWGRTDKIGTLRTSLIHYPGPIQDPDSGKLVDFKVRIDTESVALHPQFVDLDGDGALDYIGDSIRGNLLDLIRRMQGEDSEITYTAFRFDPRLGTFASHPYFAIDRVYSSSLALANTFQGTASFDADFDGDGHKDLLDLGNLEAVSVVGLTRGTDGRTLGGQRELLPPLPAGTRLAPEMRIAQFDAAGGLDALLHTEDALLVLIAPGGE